MNKKRPTSPHLTIYRFQINSIVSIMHRFTGIALFFISIALPWILLFYMFGCKACMINMFLIYSQCKIAKIFLFPIIFSMVYHAYAGIRHLFYDVGYGFSIKSTNITGWIVLISSIVVTTLLVIYI